MAQVFAFTPMGRSSSSLDSSQAHFYQRSVSLVHSDSTSELCSSIKPHSKGYHHFTSSTRRNSWTGHLPFSKDKRSSLSKHWRSGSGVQIMKVRTNLSLKIDTLKKENPQALELLYFCAYLGSKAIPRVIFKEWALPLKTDWQTCTEHLIFDGLLDYDTGSKTFSMKTRDQVFVRKQALLDQGKGVRNWLKTRVIQPVLKHFRYSPQHPATWSSTKALAPHVESVLSHAKVVGIEQLEDFAAIYWGLGLFFHRQDDLERAKDYLEKTLQCLRKQQEKKKPSHQMLGKAHTELGLLFHQQGNLEKATEHLGKALHFFQKHYGGKSNHLKLAAAHTNLGNLFYTQGALKEAEKHYQKAFDIFQQYYRTQPSHPHLALAHNHLGNLFDTQGELKQAEYHYQKALELNQLYYRTQANHPDLAPIYNNLGNLAYTQGRLEQAQKYYQKVLKIFRDSHRAQATPLSLATVYINLGNFSHSEGCFQESQKHYQKALEIYQKHYGDDSIHPDLAFVHDLLEKSFSAQGNPQEAQWHSKEASLIVQEYYRTAAVHPKLIAHHRQGRELEIQNQLEEATFYYKQSLMIANASYGNDSSHADIMICHYHLSAVFSLQKKWEEAIFHTEQALAILEKRIQVLPTASFPQVYDSHHTLHLLQRAFLHCQLGQFLQAQGEEVALTTSFKKTKEKYD